MQPRKAIARPPVALLILPASESHAALTAAGWVATNDGYMREADVPAVVEGCPWQGECLEDRLCPHCSRAGAVRRRAAGGGSGTMTHTLLCQLSRVFTADANAARGREAKRLHRIADEIAARADAEEDAGDVRWLEDLAALERDGVGA